MEECKKLFFKFLTFQKKIITSKIRLHFGPPHFENRVAGPVICIKVIGYIVEVPKEENLLESIVSYIVLCYVYMLHVCL